MAFRSFFIAAVVTMLASGGVSIAADAPWSGTWKIDVAKSKLTGSTFSYASLPDGKMRYSNGSTDVFTFACDGKPYPTIPGETVTCKSGGPTGMTLVFASGGTTSTSTETLSADGATLTTVTTTAYATKATRTTTTTSTRVGSGTGLAGTWKSAATKSSSPAVFELAATPSVITYTSKLSGATVAIKLDGSQSELTGAGVPPHIFIVAKPAGPSEIDLTQIIAGKDAAESVWSLSPDGKTLTWTSWSHGKKDESDIAIYEKQ